MNNIMISTLALMVGLTGCTDSMSNSQRIKGNGNIVTVSREVTAFDQVSVHGAGNIVLVKAQEESLTIETDENVVPVIQTSVRNGQLSIGPDNVSLNPSKGIHYTLKYKNLKALECSGAIRAEGDQIQADNFTLNITGASSAKLRAMKADSLKVDISGAVQAELSGNVKTQKVNLSGASKYRAGELKSATANVQASGACAVTLWVTNDLIAQVHGACSLDYYGAPAKSQCDTSGASQVKHLGAK